MNGRKRSLLQPIVSFFRSIDERKVTVHRQYGTVHQELLRYTLSEDR